MSYLKNTAGQYLYLAMIAKADGSALTSGTVSGYRSIDGGAQAAVTGTISHKGNGQWELALSQADTNGDEIGFLFTHASGIPVSINIVTDTKKVGGLQDLSAAAVNAEVDTALADYDAPTKAELDAGLAGLNDLDATAVQSAAAAALTTYDPPTKAELDAGLAGLNDLDATAVQAAAAAALTAYDPPTKAELDAGLAALNDFNPATDQVNANVVQISGDGPAADNLESMLDGTGGGQLSLGRLQIIGSNPAGAVFIQNTAVDGTGVIVVGQGLGAAVNLDGGHEGLYITGQTAIRAQGDQVGILAFGGSSDIVGDLNGTVAALIPTALQAIADEVWDEALAGHATPGSTGEALAGAGSAGDPWATALPGAYAAGTAGKILGDNLDAAISSRSDFNPAADQVDVGAVGGTAVSGPVDFGDHYGGAIWLNPAIGTAGTTPYVNGTALNPVDNLYDAMVLADALGIFHIKGTHDWVTPTANEPAGSSAIILEGQAVSFASAPYSTSRLVYKNCRLANGSLNNDAAYTRPIFDSVLDAVTNISVDLFGCTLKGQCGIKQNARFYNCTFGVQMNYNGAAHFSVIGGSGSILMRNMTSGFGWIFGTDNMDVYIESNCTAGTLMVSGNVYLNRYDTGLIINHRNKVEDMVWDEALAGHATAGSTGEALANAGAAGTPPTAVAIADEVLKRGVANVEDTADPASLAAIILATLESSIAGSTWTIRKTGGATFITKTVTTDPAADPITGVT